MDFKFFFPSYWVCCASVDRYLFTTWNNICKWRPFWSQPAQNFLCIINEIKYKTNNKPKIRTSSLKNLVRLWLWPKSQRPSSQFPNTGNSFSSWSEEGVNRSCCHSEAKSRQRLSCIMWVEYSQSGPWDYSSHSSNRYFTNLTFPSSFLSPTNSRTIL